MADSLSNTTNQFALYLLDPSIENFAVSKSGKVYLVDVENVLVVDLWENRQGRHCSLLGLIRPNNIISFFPIMSFFSYTGSHFFQTDLS